MKSSIKPQSISTDTRISNSNIFNNSYLANSSAPDLNKFMYHKIRESEYKQVEFIRQKNLQLNEKVRRLITTTKQLEESNRTLLAMNRKYVNIVNRYYENQNRKINQTQHNKKQKLYSKDDCSSQNNNTGNLLSNTEAHRVLGSLEKDHRNLVKHCLVMEQQIMCYNEQINHFNQMKDQLYAVNHTSVDQLIGQLHDLTNQNKALKKENNLITYEFEKSKFECQNMKKMHGLKQSEAGSSELQITKMRSLVSTTKQQCSDKSKVYEARIYELELKVEKLEHELRTGQQSIFRTDQQRKGLVMKHVEHIHDYEKLQKSYSQLESVIHKQTKIARGYSVQNNKKKRAADFSGILESSEILSKSYATCVSKPKRKQQRPRKSLVYQSNVQ